MAISITEVTKVEDVVGKVENGSGRRRATFLVRATTDATSNTLNLATYDSAVQGIEGVDFHSVDEANRATYPTWSGTTLTFAGHTGSGRTVAKVTVFY
jgi:hypothetical protein